MPLTAAEAAVVAAGCTLAGVIVTQVGNAFNKRSDARIKREDREQDRALDWENRVWQAKSGALLRLISGCRFIKGKVQQARTDKPGDENYRRGAAIRALDQFTGRIGDEDGISEVHAYGADPVRNELEKLLKEVRVQQREHGASLSDLGSIGDRLYRLGKEEPLEDDSRAERQQHSNQYDDLMSQREQVFRAIGSASNLDVDEKVIALCDRVIDVARIDLGASRTESGRQSVLRVHRWRRFSTYLPRLRRSRPKNIV